MSTNEELTRTTNQLVQLVTAVGGPLTVATALLFYFGWVRTSVEASELGVNDAIFGYSTQDYVMRSITALFVPLLVAAIIAIGVLVLHGWLLRGIDAGARRWVVRALAVCALPACVVIPVVSELAELRWPELDGLIVPLGIAVGLLTTGYGVVLRRHTRPASIGTDEQRRNLRVRVLVGIVVAAALFWWVGDFAAVVGRGLAYRVAANVATLPGVVIYSERNLRIDGVGVHVTRLSAEPGTEASAYIFRYDGLRLLERSNERLFLLPDSWTIEVGTMVVIADDERVRVEYTHGAG